MGEREEVGKIREEKHESKKEKYFLGRKKSSSDFTKRGQINCDVLGKCRNLREEVR